MRATFFAGPFGNRPNSSLVVTPVPVVICRSVGDFPFNFCAESRQKSITLQWASVSSPRFSSPAISTAMSLVHSAGSVMYPSSFTCTSIPAIDLVATRPSSCRSVVLPLSSPRGVSPARVMSLLTGHLRADYAEHPHCEPEAPTHIRVTHLLQQRRQRRVDRLRYLDFSLRDDRADEAQDLRLGHVLDHAQDQHDVVAQVPEVFLSEGRDHVVHDLHPTLGEGEVALVLGRLEKVSSPVEGVADEGADRLPEVGQALELVEHRVQVAGVTHETLE